MTNPSQIFGASVKKIARANIAALAPFAPRRAGFGSTPGLEREGAERLRQPQDGAPIRAKLATIAAHMQGDVLQESEDARLTGGTRSLARRLLGLNLRNKPRKVSALSVGTLAQPKVA